VLVSAVGYDSDRASPRFQPQTRLSEVKFPSGDGPDCLQFFLENGDLKTGPSTAIMKTAPKCVVPPHYHTAEEQLIIVKGNVSTGMQGMQDTVACFNSLRTSASSNAMDLLFQLLQPPSSRSSFATACFRMATVRCRALPAQPRHNSTPLFPTIEFA
jgi:hypothetical protein